MKSRRIAWGICLFLLVAGEATAQKVTVEYDRTVSFVRFKTYSWAEGAAVKSPIMDEQITRSVDRELEAKGLKKVTPENKPDLLVTYGTAFNSEVRFNTVDYGWKWGSAVPNKIPEGTLIVSLGTAGNKRLVWTGKATSTVDDYPEKAEKKISAAVEKMFRKYPLPIVK